VTHFIAPKGKQGSASPSGAQRVGRPEPALLGAQAQGTGFTGTLQDGLSRNKGQAEAITTKGLAAVVWPHWVEEEESPVCRFLGVLSLFLSHKLILIPPVRLRLQQARTRFLT